MFFYFDATRLALSSWAPRLLFEDSALFATAVKLATLIEQDPSAQRPYIEALGVVLSHELLRIISGKAGAAVAVTGGLATWQRRKVVTYIEKHLTEPISLAALARLVGLSSCYFCRAFRRSFGMPPLHYQLRRRIEHAKTLLARHAELVTDVSLALGYSDTSAFCTAFRRVTGMTPGAYRRSLG
jgi:AraC family transcriptional regulator